MGSRLFLDPIRLVSVTTTQRDALTVAAGDMIWNSTLAAKQIYNGSAWVTISASAWDSIVAVSGSDATTTGQSLVDITGLTAAVTAASTYEFQAVLKSVASADTNGYKVAVHCTQTLVSVAATVAGNTALTTLVTAALLAQDTATLAAAGFNTTSGGLGIVTLHGQFVTHATVDGTFSIQHLKITSGTSTIKVGSTLKIRKVA